MTVTVWDEGTDEASSRRGGRSSGWSPGLGTTTFTVSLCGREEDTEKGSALMARLN